jgi:DNA-binding protein H-NS
MSDKDLATIRQQIARLESRARRLEAAASDRKRKAVQEVLALMKKSGVTVDDLREPAKGRGAASRPARARPAEGRPRAKAAVKYRDPQTSDAWTGRGRTPRWLAALEAQGRSRDEFLVSAG